MDQNSANKQVKPKQAATSTVALRVKRETKRRVLAELTKINRKDFGKLVRADELLDVLLSLLQPHHLKSLQDASMTNSDRFEMRYRDHIKKHGHVTKDEFLGLIMAPTAAKDSGVLEQSGKEKCN